MDKRSIRREALDLATKLLAADYGLSTAHPNNRKISDEASDSDQMVELDIDLEDGDVEAMVDGEQAEVIELEQPIVEEPMAEEESFEDPLAALRAPVQEEMRPIPRVYRDKQMRMYRKYGE